MSYHTWNGGRPEFPQAHPSDYSSASLNVHARQPHPSLLSDGNVYAPPLSGYVQPCVSRPRTQSTGGQPSAYGMPGPSSAAQYYGQTTYIQPQTPVQGRRARAQSSGGAPPPGNHAIASNPSLYASSTSLPHGSSTYGQSQRMQSVAGGVAPQPTQSRHNPVTIPLYPPQSSSFQRRPDAPTIAQPQPLNAPNYQPPLSTGTRAPVYGLQPSAVALTESRHGRDKWLVNFRFVRREDRLAPVVREMLSSKPPFLDGPDRSWIPTFEPMNKGRYNMLEFECVNGATVDVHITWPGYAPTVAKLDVFLDQELGHWQTFDNFAMKLAKAVRSYIRSVRSHGQIPPPANHPLGWIESELSKYRLSRSHGRDDSETISVPGAVVWGDIRLEAVRQLESADGAIAWYATFRLDSLGSVPVVPAEFQWCW